MLRAEAETQADGTLEAQGASDSVGVTGNVKSRWKQVAIMFRGGGVEL